MPEGSRFTAIRVIMIEITCSAWNQVLCAQYCHERQGSAYFYISSSRRGRCIDKSRAGDANGCHHTALDQAKENYQPTKRVFFFLWSKLNSWCPHDRIFNTRGSPYIPKRAVNCTFDSWNFFPDMNTELCRPCQDVGDQKKKWRAFLQEKKTPQMLYMPVCGGG